MPLINLRNQVQRNTMRKEDFANLIMTQLIQENPIAAKVNAATLRDFVMRVVGYNELPDEYFKTSKPTGFLSICSMAIPNGNLAITVKMDTGQVLKVCPICKMTARVEDPICIGCSHVYENHDAEAAVVAASIRKCKEDMNLVAGVRRGKGNVVLQDEVEGITLTERDIDKYMTNIDKYIPSR